MAKVALFNSFNEVEHWAQAHGVERLREVLPNLSETSAFLASAWLKRFDSCLRIAIDQKLVRHSGGGERRVDVGARVIQGPWRRHAPVSPA